MKVAFGLKAHSGWAALVVLGKNANELLVVDRRRVELVEQEWARQPYHAAEDLNPEDARELVKRGIDEAHRIAVREIHAAIELERQRKNQVAACAVLMGNPMPDWSVGQILAVHFRMHKAEGVLFREALVRAAKENKLKLLEIAEKTLINDAERKLVISAADLAATIAAIGKTAGPPWGKDQKDAAVAALVALSVR
jgi:hypothetical protein